ncbi:MAG TPA: Smr/MutS family protein, partial [bacterium]|nr:Smr/MutS family protein [bacterium]
LDPFLEAVEFPQVLRRLAEGCATPAGRENLTAFRPLAEGEALAGRLARTEQLEQQVIRHGEPPVPSPEDFEPAFLESVRTGRSFSAAELGALLRFLDGMARLRRFLSLGDGPAPALAAWLARLGAFPALKDFLSARVSDQGDVRDGASPELKSARGSLRALRAEVQEAYQRFLQGSGEALQEKLVTEREGRFVVPVKRDHQSQVPGFVHGTSASGATLFVEPQALAERNHRLREAALREDEEVRRVLRACTEAVLAEAEGIQAALSACAEIDAHAALARFASRFEARFLAPAPGGAFRLVGARHPLLALEAGEAFREKVVPLDLDFSNGTRVLLLSGPNAGGKTVALKTLGLCCAMAQAGLPVLAGGASSFPWLTRFDTDLSDEQDLEGHLSTYAAKLTALKRMLDGCDGGTLLLLDELGSGTDPREGGALGLACLEAFREKGALVFANTHQPLLKLLTQEEKGMANAAMLFDEATGKPTFKLVVGLPGRSYALTLATQLGFDPAVLERAKAHLPPGEADLSGLLASLAGEKQRAEEARREAEQARDRVKKTEAELLVARRQIKDEARRVRREAQIEAEGIVKNTRRQMDHLIQGVAPAGELDRGKVRQAQREVGRKLGNIPRAAERPRVELRELKPGDAVHFKNGHSRAKVLEADDDKQTAVILLEGGLKLSCQYADLGPLGPAPARAPLRPQPTALEKAKADKGALELDLRGRLVDQALPLLDKFIDDALLVDLPFVRIIHGKGTGALKEAIHKHLPVQHPQVEFSLAEPAQGGAGVTVVRFKK